MGLHDSNGASPKVSKGIPNGVVNGLGTLRAALNTKSSAVAEPQTLLAKFLAGQQEIEAYRYYLWSR